MFDSGVILLGEIRCWSLLRVKGLLVGVMISDKSVVNTVGLLILYYCKYCKQVFSVIVCFKIGHK